MTAASVARVYAEALFQLAAERGRREVVDQEVGELRRILAAHREIRNFLVSAGVPKEEKFALLERALAPHVDPVTYHFLRLVVRKGREPDLERILAAYEERVREAEGRILVRVRAARPVPADILERIRRVVADGHPVDLETTVDRGLLGGLAVQVGDRLVDATLRARLARLRERMLGERR